MAMHQADPLSPEQLTTALASLPGWQLIEGMLVAKFAFSDFNEALGFMVRVGLLAEQAQHHPEIVNVWNKVTLKLVTHDAGSQITRKDTDMARAIAKLGAQADQVS